MMAVVTAVGRVGVAMVAASFGVTILVVMVAVVTMMVTVGLGLESSARLVGLVATMTVLGVPLMGLVEQVRVVEGWVDAAGVAVLVQSMAVVSWSVVAKSVGPVAGWEESELVGSVGSIGCVTGLATATRVVVNVARVSLAAVEEDKVD